MLTRMRSCGSVGNALTDYQAAIGAIANLGSNIPQSAIRISQLIASPSHDGQNRVQKLVWTEWFRKVPFETVAWRALTIRVLC
jgi:hypothetical protein